MTKIKPPRKPTRVAIEHGPCSEQPCPKIGDRRGMCIDHYAVWYKTIGVPQGLVRRNVSRNATLDQKLDAYTTVNTDNGCWERTGWTTGFGYGQIWWQGKFQYMHILRYELEVSTVPEGFDVDHLCERKKCSNQHHLEHVPHRINALRGSGHPAQLHLLRTGCLCPDRTAESCPVHGQLHWRPDWRECLDDVATGRVYDLPQAVAA